MRICFSGGCKTPLDLMNGRGYSLNSCSSSLLTQYIAVVWSSGSHSVAVVNFLVAILHLQMHWARKLTPIRDWFNGALS